MVQVYPSLICADLINLEAEIARLDPVISGYHLDVMDFHYVPNLTWGPDFIRAISKATQKPLMVHLMVDYPEKYLDLLTLTSKDYLSVHPESTSDLSFPDLLNKISRRGLTPSIALNPETPISCLAPLNKHAQHVLLMAVHPGFSGQKLLPLIYDKLTQLQDLKVEKPYTMAVDGGVTFENAPKLLAQGADQLIAGSAIFGEPDAVEAAKRLSQIAFPT